MSDEADPPGDAGRIEPILFRPKRGQRVNLWVVNGDRRWMEPVEVVRVWRCGRTTDAKTGKNVPYGECEVKSVVGGGFEGMKAVWVDRNGGEDHEEVPC